jgi:hypothetical protein
MKMARRTVKSVSDGWAVLWTSDNQLDGFRQYLEGGVRFDRLPQFAGYRTMVFPSRSAARDFIKREYGYIAERPDLRREPHCWRVPRPVRVRVTVTPQT